jgi:hypothetical protein
VSRHVPAFVHDPYHILINMRTFVTSALSLSLLGAAAAAQYTGEGPFRLSIGPYNATNGTAFLTSLQATGITQVGSLCLRPAPGGPAGSYYLAMTCMGVPNANGGRGGWDGVTGTWDANTGALTLNSDVGSAGSSLNLTDDQFASNVDSSLRYFVQDQGASQAAMFASRAGTSGPFTQVALLGTGPGFFDVNLFNIQDPMSGTVKLYVHWIDAGGQQKQSEVNPATGAFISTVDYMTNIISPATHSQSAMNDRNGITRACAFARNTSTGSAADAHFYASPYALSQQQEIMWQVNTDTTWEANPATIGGRVIWANASGASYTAPRQIDTVSCASTVGPAGGTITLTAFVPPVYATGIPWSVLMILGPLAPGPISLTPFGGQGNLGVLPSIFLPVITADPNVGDAQYPPIGVPANAPPGTEINLQAIGVNFNGGFNFYASNTGKATVL